jgi:hypothetical protein
MESLHATERGQISLALSVAFDRAPANAGIAGTILPLATLPLFASIGKSFDQQDPGRQLQPKRLSCTADPVSVDHGEGFFRTFALVGGSTR